MIFDMEKLRKNQRYMQLCNYRMTVEEKIKEIGLSNEIDPKRKRNNSAALKMFKDARKNLLSAIHKEIEKCSD